MKLKATLKYNRLPQLEKQIETRAGDAVQGSLDAIVQGAQQRSRVDSGEMQGAWHKETEGALDGTVTNDDPKVVFHEFGTSKLPAQPMAGPAAEAERSPFLSAMRKVAD